MRSTRAIVLGAALALLCPSGAAYGQTGTPPAAPSATSEAPTWTGLPFTSLADYERLIPIGMSRGDLVRALGEPEAITPGREADQAHHYAYTLSDGRALRAVIIVRDGAVLIRRLYISSPAEPATRLN